MTLLRKKTDSGKNMPSETELGMTSETELVTTSEIGSRNSKAAEIKKKLRKHKKLVIGIVVLVVLLVAASMLLHGGGSKGGGGMDYVTETVSTRSITKSLSGSGTLQPANSYTVVTLIEGDILSADFEEGDIVEKDTVLYQIDSSNASKNIEKSQISYNQAQRSYNNTVQKQYVKATTAGTVYSLNVKVGDEISQGQTIAVIRDSGTMSLKVPFPVDDAKSFYVGESAVITLDSTFETLNGTVTEISGADIVGDGNMITRNVTIEVKNPGGLSDSQRATASINGINCAGSGTFTYRSDSTVTAEASGTVTAIKVAEGGTVTKDQVILTIGGSDMNDQLSSAQENLRNAQLSMESMQEQLDDYTITSPISGTIVDKQYKAGDTVESGKQLCTIYDLSYLEMTLSIDELDISSLEVGQSVRITADAVEGKEYTGVVTKVSVAGTTSGGTTVYPVTVRIDETDGLLPGMNVDAEIVISEADNVLAIPNGAVNRNNLVLITKDSPSAVNAVEQENLEAPEGYVYVEVETGLSDDDYVEITSGLQEGDTVAYIRVVSSSDDTMMMPMGMGGGMGGGMTGGGGAPGGGGGAPGGGGGAPGGGGGGR
jgi:HlyD family secretion protein